MSEIDSTLADVRKTLEEMGSRMSKGTMMAGDVRRLTWALEIIAEIVQAHMTAHVLASAMQRDEGGGAG